MTQPSEQPRTLRMVARIHPDIAAILKEPEVLTEFKRYAKHLWGSGVAIEAEGSISRISGGPLEQPVHTKGTVGPFWDEIEAWRDGYRAGLSARQSDDLTEGDGA